MDMTLEIMCPMCGQLHYVELNENDYLDWIFDDKLAQEAFPYLTPTEREQIITRICPECQDRLYG